LSGRGEALWRSPLEAFSAKQDRPKCSLFVLAAIPDAKTLRTFLVLL
jgi:hypothetical protein